METLQDRQTLLLRKNRTIYFCDGCLAMKMGAFHREVQDALGALSRGGDRFPMATGQCSECLQTKSVIRTLAA